MAVLPAFYLVRSIRRHNCPIIYVRYEVSMAVKIQVKVFWVVTPRSVVVGYTEDGCSKVL